jgi:phosphoglycolate phosphatase-like HAD superfamily hydrolase
MESIMIEKYSSIVFDCDGVLLNSNKLKSDAFYKAALPYGEVAANALVSYHVKNGGVSRYIKFELFLRDLIPKGALGPSIDELLNVYATEVRQSLLSCEVAKNLAELREKTKSSDWFIVSGGDQEELREVFKLRGLETLFNGGIYGSPLTKDEILTSLINSDKISESGVFLGDSKYDYLAATKANLDFIFVSDWSEFSGWETYFDDKEISYANDLHELI